MGCNPKNESCGFPWFAKCFLGFFVLNAFNHWPLANEIVGKIPSTTRAQHIIFELSLLMGGLLRDIPPGN